LVQSMRSKLIVMPSQAQQPQSPQSDRAFLQLLSPWADVLSKATVGIVVALYSSGFLITSLHQSKFGFSEANPFRERILAAGAWFFLFTGVPVVIVTTYQSLHPQMNWKMMANWLYFFFLVCSGASWPALMLFSFSTASPDHTNKWWLIFGLIALLGLIIVRDLKKLPDYVSPIISIVLVLLFVAQDALPMIVHHQFQQTAITLWFFAIGVATLFITTKVPVRFEDATWVQPFFYLLVVLFLFSLYYYPNLKSSWGGGSPVPVTLYFSKDSALKPNQSVSALMVDESDSGYYIVGPHEKKAIFVPRSAVSLVYFSDKISDSKLLK
jgi:hypothetical protein